MDDGEGSAITVDVNGSTLAVGTSQAVVRLWDLARREARPIGVYLTVPPHVYPYLTVHLKLMVLPHPFLYLLLMFLCT